MSKPITMTVAGFNVPLNPHAAKKTGNTFWAYGEPGKAPSYFGAPCPKLADEIPTVVEVLGQNVTLEDVVVQEYRDKDTGQVKVKTFPYGTKRRGQAEVTVDGATKKFTITIALRQDGSWNVTASIKGTGTGSSRPALDLSALGITAA